MRRTDDGGVRMNGAGNERPRRNNNPGSGGNNQGKQARRNNQAKPAKPTVADFWRIPPKSTPPPPITPATDPTALLRSLGRPPLDQNGADRYLGAVAERASGLATALAVAGGILAPGPED
jgi:hypothetical protein